MRRITQNAAGEKVAVEFAGQTRTTVATDRGRWQVVFDPCAAGGPHELRVTDSFGAVLLRHDLLIGEVWLFSGQSNMGGPLATCPGGPETFAAEALPEVRIGLQFGAPAIDGRPAAVEDKNETQSCYGPGPMDGPAIELDAAAVRIGRRLVCPPGDVLIGPYEQRIAAIDPFQLRLLQRQHLQWNFCTRRRVDKRCHIAPAKIRQREPRTEPIEQRDGWVEIPQGPGLGIEIDRAALARFAA